MNDLSDICGAEKTWLKERFAAVRPLLCPAFASAGLALLLCHYLFLVNGYTGPDGLCEGLLWATNLSWNIRLGRWIMAWSRQASLSIVMPALFWAANTVAIAISTLLLADMWKLRSCRFVILCCISLAVAPAVVWQALVVHLTLCFTLAMLLGVVCVYLVFMRPSPFRFCIAVLCLTLSMGGYQAYVGLAAGLTLLTIVLCCLRGEALRPMFGFAGKMLGTGLLSGAAYLAITKVTQLMWHTTMADYCGADQISLGQSLARLAPSLTHAYQDFFGYYRMETAHIGTAFGSCLILTALYALLYSLHNLRKQPANFAVAAACVLILPLAFNAIDVIAPDVRVDRLMSYPMQFMLPFCMAVWTLPAARSLHKAARLIGTVLTVCVCWMFAISATATYRSVELSYKYVGTLTDSILAQVLADPEYTVDTRILMAGFPDESRVQNSNALYWFSQYQRSPLFWGGTHGLLDCWPTYLYDYHGIDAGAVTLDEYRDIVSSEEFAAMPLYPQEGSMAYFGDILVVKLQNDLP